ncbi:ABC transporter ATP-binding protein [Phytohabitans kaempferiae]|uniref:ABC transporter ATP-binding protein n=1 Tax=Phytohabitans kaempferiae TaxID=1620943 RepID=A0ABV6M3D0_9ACTN
MSEPIRSGSRAGLDVSGVSVRLRTGARLIEPLSEVNFHIAPGERVALVGESGCGKSVLMRSLVRLVPPAVLDQVRGSARIGDIDLLASSLEQIRAVRGRRIGMVFQDASTYLNPTMTIGKQIGEALPEKLRADRAQARARVSELLASVGLDARPEFQRRYPHELSGGMRQRVLIAVALAGDPDLLFADEPTTALDVTVQAQILLTLDEVVRTRGMGLLLVTHDLGVVAQMCERMYVMYAGQIVESGPVAEVFRAPRHPYTRALLDCLLTIDRPAQELRTIRGVVPPPEAFGSGCRFADRCDQRMPVCDNAPGEYVVAAGHTSRCWLHAPEKVGSPR